MASDNESHIPLVGPEAVPGLQGEAFVYITELGPVVRGRRNESTTGGVEEGFFAGPRPGWTAASDPLSAFGTVIDKAIKPPPIGQQTRLFS